MKGASVNTSIEATLFDNNIMATINRLKNQYKRTDLASIYKNLTKYLDLHNFTEDHLKKINTLLVSREIIEKPNRDRLSYVLNGNTSLITAQTDPAFDYLYETQVTPLSSPFSTTVLDRQIEIPTIGQQQPSSSILENELFSDTMLKKSHYKLLRRKLL